MIPRPNGKFFDHEKWFLTYLTYIKEHTKIIRIFTHWFFTGMCICARWGQICPRPPGWNRVDECLLHSLCRAIVTPEFPRLIHLLLIRTVTAHKKLFVSKFDTLFLYCSLAAATPSKSELDFYSPICFPPDFFLGGSKLGDFYLYHTLFMII